MASEKIRFPLNLRARPVRRFYLHCVAGTSLTAGRLVLLMCIELMLLAVNFNFVAVSRFRGHRRADILVFSILDRPAAAERPSVWLGGWCFSAERSAHRRRISRYPLQG